MRSSTSAQSSGCGQQLPTSTLPTSTFAAAIALVMLKLVKRVPLRVHPWGTMKSARYSTRQKWEEYDFAGWNSMRLLFFAIFINLLMMGAIQLLANYIWPECTPGVPCKYKKSQLEIFANVVQTRLPPLKAFADSADFSSWGADTHAAASDVPSRDCATPWLVSFKRLQT